MPPAPARNFFVILFDMKTESRKNALKALSTVLLYKRLARVKDQYKIYLVNSARSTNNLPEGMFYLDANTNIETIFSELVTIETGSCDWLTAIKVAIGDLREWFEKPGIISLQILFISDLSSFECRNDKELLRWITDNLNSYNMFLYTIGPDIEPPNLILSGDDVEEWMQSLNVDNHNNLNLKVMKEIITKTPRSVMCCYDLGVHLFNSFVYKKGMQPWQVPLTFGTIWEVDVSTRRITKKGAPFKLKKTNARRYDNFRWVFEDEEDVEFVDQTISGIVRHEKFVKIDTDGMFKIEGLRTFSVLGFTSAKNLPEYLLQSDGSYLVIPKGNMLESDFYSALVDELEESNKYIIARRVYVKNANPKFVALIPNEQDMQAAPKVDKNQDAYTFLDSININGDNCKIKVPLATAMMNDPNCLNIIKKAIEKKNMEEKLETKPDHSNVNFQQWTDDLKNAWPIREMLKAKKEENSADDFNEIGDFDFS